MSNPTPTRADSDAALEALREKLLAPLGRRQPEPETTVFALGHYEQMQIALLTQFALDHAWQHADDRDSVANEIDLEVVRGLRNGIFDGHATLTIIRKGDEQ